MKRGRGVVIRYSSTHEKTLCPTDLSDEEWKYVEPHVPRPKGQGGPRIHSFREILNATFFYVLRSGCQWRMLPNDFPRDGLPRLPLLLQKMAHRRHLGEDRS